MTDQVQADDATDDPVNSLLNVIRPNSLWQHKSGRFYEVTQVANKPDEKAYPLTFVYAGLAGSPSSVWSAPASDWHRRMLKLWPMDASEQHVLSSPDWAAWQRFTVDTAPNLIVDKGSGGKYMDMLIVDEEYRVSLHALCARLNHLNHVRHMLIERLFWKAPSGILYSHAIKQADLALEAISSLNIRL